MSFSELNDWDPMEEDFRKSEKLFNKNSYSDGFDECCLYIKNIPVSVSQDILHNLMADEGRIINRIMINRKLSPGSEVTYGFVNFANSKDARTAMKALNGSPPLHLNISFARKKKDNENKDSHQIERKPLLNTPVSSDSAYHNKLKHDGNGTGRGMSAMNGYTNNAMNETSVLAGSRGRGIRIDLDGHKAISQKIKVTTGGSGRTVMMASPEKTAQSKASSELKTTSHQGTTENCKPSQQPVTLQKINSTRSGAGAPELIPNPFFYCFKCAKEAHHSCGICKKPYCSKTCQVADWLGHQYVCKLAKGASESALVSFKNSQVQANDSSYMSEASSSDCEKSLDPECVSVKSVQRLNNENHHSYQSPASSLTTLTEYTPNKRKLPNARRMPKNTAEDGCKVIEKVSFSAGQVEKVSIINIESPSKFWVRLEKLANTLLSLEKELQRIQRVNISHIYPNLFCCTVNGDMICRGKIQKETSNEAQVYLLDHGKTLIVPKSNIFCLPKEFGKYPIQAVCCKLGDNAVKGDIRWNNDESLSFKIHTDNKIYKAIVLNSSDEINEVSLINEDGISLYSILAEEKNAMSCIDELPQASEGDNAPPSAWSKLKPGVRITLVPAILNEDSSWFYFSFNGGADLAEIIEIEKLLVNYSGEDITVCAEEGDFAAGFSSEYQQFYRCLILNRKRGSFLVRYIDYGNEEEITRLNALSSELFQKCSYTIQCKRPASLSLDDFKKLVSRSDAEVVVVKAGQNVAELSFSSYKQDNMLCYPCYFPSQSESNNVKSPVPSSNNDLSCVPKQVTSPKHVDPKIVARKVLQPKALSLNMKYNVKIVFIKDVSDVCVQLSEDEGKMNAMLMEFNKYCSSKSTSYMPIVGEIVCCKFSDGAWYRGQVKDIVKDKCKILFVDYGNEDIVSCKDILYLPEKFSCPKFGTSVSLSGIKNENITKKLLGKLLEEFWDMKVIDNTKSPIEVMLFLQNTSLDSLIEKKNLRSKNALKFRKLPTGPVDVKISYEDQKYLYFHQVKEMKSLEEYCIKLNCLSTAPIPQKPVINNVYCGLFSDGLWYRVALEEISSNSYTVNFLDYGNSEKVSLDGLREISNDLFAQPIYCIPAVAQNRNDVSLNLEDQYSVEVVEVKNEVQEVKFLNVPKPVKLHNVSSLKKQQLGDGANEVLICYETGDIRYCQLSSDNDNVVNMFKPLQKCSKEEKSPNSLSTGDIICARSSDGLWYRASVVSDKKAPMYNVLFFDYGNTECVSIDSIRFLPEELIKPPIFAIPIKIQNTELLNDPDVFTNLVSVKKIKMENDVHIVEILLKKGSGLPKMSSFDKTLLPTDSASKVTLCHVDDDLFYVQPASIEDKLAKLITSLLEAESFKDLPQLPEVDDVICAKFSTDGVWYRSSVNEICADKKSVKVSFFDYGNSETISLENIKILPSELCSFPILCVPIKFKDYSAVEKLLLENITTFNVEVLSMDGSIPVVDIVDQNNRKSPVKSIVPAYNPVYISSFKISALPPKEPFKVEFKKCVDKFYFAVKCSDYSEINALSSFLQTNVTKPISHMPFVDEILLVRRDNLWHRGCIKEVESDKNKCKVYFIDLAITEEIPKSDLCLLPEECKSFPIFVIKVLVETEEPIILEKQYLIQVSNQNSDGTLIVKVYHQHLFSSIDRRELPLNEEQSVIFYHKEKDLLFLQNLSDIEVISEVETALGNCSSLPSIPYKPTVGELVCAMSQSDKAWYRGCVEEVLSSNDYKILFIDYGNSEVVSEQHLQCIPSVLIKFPSLCIPIKFAENHIAESMEILKIYSVVAQSKPSDNVQIISLAKPEEKDIKDVTNERNIASENASNTSSTSKTFKYSSSKYVPLNPGTQNIAIYSVDEGFFIFAAPFNQENITANIQLPGELTEYCTSNGRPFVDGCEPMLDDMVLARYSEDNQWYRAVIIDKSPPLYDVNFVDYGNSEQLDISCLRKMEEQFMTLDIQAHLCSLTGFTVSSENLEKVSEELKKFSIFSCPEPLEAHVEINDGDIAINVPKITSFLVEKKLAVASNQI